MNYTSDESVSAETENLEQGLKAAESDTMNVLRH
jgi:hypothetical protein